MSESDTGKTDSKKSKADSRIMQVRMASEAAKKSKSNNSNDTSNDDSSSDNS